MPPTVRRLCAGILSAAVAALGGYALSAVGRPADGTLPAPQQPFSCRITAVSDGDTVECLGSGNVRRRIRLAGIDAPEKAQAYGSKAKRCLSDLVYGRTVTVEPHGSDRYKRLLATLRVGGQNANLALVRAGCAWVYREYPAGGGYADAEADARRERRGLWADPRPVYPSDFRRQQRKQP